MVYHGPSKGCRACRKRRVKCDQGKPACNNCTKRKVECPGYESTFDYRHRNQTTSTILRVQQKADTSRRSSDTSAVTITDSTCSFSSDDVPGSTLLPPSMDMAIVQTNHDSPRSSAFGSPLAFDTMLVPDPETLIINWYFENYPMKSIDPQSSHGFVNILQPLYFSASDDSPLKSAAAAVGTQLFMLFQHQGSDTPLARRFYGESITKMKNAITDPFRSKQDDLLLTTLALHFYDMLSLRWSAAPSDYTHHRKGALALLKHRGSILNGSEAAKHITTCMRTAFCHWALESGMGMSSEVRELLTEDALPTNKACELDLVTMEMVEFQGRFNKFYKCRIEDTQDLDEMKSMIEEGLKVDSMFSGWELTVPNHWIPLYASAEEVLPSIREAGFYGDRCAVYWDLSIADTWNSYRTRRLKLLRMVRQLYMDLMNSQHAKAMTLIEDTMQRLADEQCMSLPFQVGDVKDAMNHTKMYELNYPSASNGICTYPNPDHDHPRAAASAGGWMASSAMMNVAKLAIKDGNLESFPLRRGQFQWMLGQLDRMQKVFLLSQPTHRASWKTLHKIF